MDNYLIITIKNSDGSPGNPEDIDRIADLLQGKN